MKTSSIAAVALKVLSVYLAGELGKMPLWLMSSIAPLASVSFAD